MSEMNKASSILRDIFNDTFSGIIVDDETLHVQVKDYVQEIAPHKESIVKFYKNGVPLFEKYGIERQIKTSFGRTVSMAKGAYLIIEHTEALHVIDVNSGNRSNKEKNQEDTALEVNLISASEIARQLRLRDMGGIIVIDFIDMNRAENRKNCTITCAKKCKMTKQNTKYCHQVSLVLCKLQDNAYARSAILKHKKRIPMP